MPKSALNRNPFSQGTAKESQRKPTPLRRENGQTGAFLARVGKKTKVERTCSTDRIILENVVAVARGVHPQ